jgi:hypothetical protein
VGVALANLAVATVKKQLSLVATGDLSRSFSSICLSSMHRPRSPIRGDLNAPAPLARHDVNIAFRHAPVFPDDLSGKRG